MDIEVRGRTTGNASRLRSKVRIEPGSVTIRIDDHLNPPAWIEFELTTDQLDDLAEQARTATEEE